MTPEEKNKKLIEIVKAKTEKYGDNADVVNMVATNVRGLLAEAAQRKIEVDVEKPSENGMSFEELVDRAVENTDKVMGYKPTTPPPSETNYPPSEPKIEPKGDKPEVKDPKKDARELPSGARVPDDIDPSEVMSVQVTDPITSQGTATIVEARRRLKMRQQTSKQQNDTDKALEGILSDIMSESQK